MFSRVQNVHKRILTVKAELGPSSFKKRRKIIKKNYAKTFQKVRTKEAKEEFKKALPKVHVPSAKEQVRGIDVACIVQGKVQLGLLYNKENNLTVLRQEWKERLQSQMDPPRVLTQREINQIHAMKILEVKKKIKQHEKTRDEGNEGYDERFFKPLYTSLADYKWEIVKKK